MSESPPQNEGGFGAPPGATPWPQPGPQPAPPIPQAYPAYPAPGGSPALGYPPPQGQPYGARPGQPAYQPAYPGYLPSAAQPAYAGYAPTTTSPFPISTFVLLLVSVISLVATGIIGIPSAIIAVLAWRRNGADPAAARKGTMTGWIVYAINFAIGVPLLIWFYVWALSNQ